MSAELLGWAYRQKTGSPITKAVLIKLVDNANDEGYARPSVAHLVSRLELSDKAVREHLKKLENLGLLVVIRKRISEKVNLPNRYQLQIHAVSSLGEVPAVRGGMAPNTPPLGYDRGEGTNCPTPPLGYDMPREPLSEPSREPLVEPSSTAVAETGGPTPLSLAVEAYNKGAVKCPKWTTCKQITAQRGKVIEARLREVGLAGWCRAVDLAMESAFLGGPVPTHGDHRNWRLDIAWFAKAQNFAKICEGGYPPPDGPGGSGPRGVDSAMAGLGDFFQRAGG